MQGDFEAQKLFGTGGAKIDGGLGAFGDGVDTGAARNGAEVECGPRISGRAVCDSTARAEASAAMGFGVPASVKLWPPGPVMST